MSVRRKGLSERKKKGNNENKIESGVDDNEMFLRSPSLSYGLKVLEDIE